jgi:quercetin dioxygenase-like cupin family protein
MDEKFNEATHNRPEGDRPVDAPIVKIDIPSFIKQLKKEKAWDKNDRNSITVFKTDKMRVVLLAMHRKAEMSTERPENVLTVQVIKGKLRISTKDDSKEITNEEMLALHEGIDYKIKALKKSIFLLTVAG